MVNLGWRIDGLVIQWVLRARGKDNLTRSLYAEWSQTFYQSAFISFLLLSFDNSLFKFDFNLPREPKFCSLYNLWGGFLSDKIRWTCRYSWYSADTTLKALYGELVYKASGTNGMKQRLCLFSGFVKRLTILIIALISAVLFFPIIVESDSPFFLYLISHLDLFMAFWSLTENMNKECPIR